MQSGSIRKGLPHGLHSFKEGGRHTSSSLHQSIQASDQAREEAWQKAEKVIADDLPRKILALTEQVKVTFRGKPSEEILRGCALPPPESCTPTSQFPANTVVTDILESFNREVMSTLDMLNVLKIAIALAVPAASSGNNFGVAVQAQTIMTISHTEDNVFSLLEAVTKYTATRASIITKLGKQPFLEDHREAIRQLDIKAHLDAVVWGLELRDDLAILLDTIQKNFTNLRNPRPSDAAVSSTLL